MGTVSEDQTATVKESISILCTTFVVLVYLESKKISSIGLTGVEILTVGVVSGLIGVVGARFAYSSNRYYALAQGENSTATRVLLLGLFALTIFAIEWFGITFTSGPILTMSLAATLGLLVGAFLYSLAILAGVVDSGA